MASTYLSKTFGSAGNRDLWTFSCWVKKSKNGSEQRLLTTSDNSTFDDNIRFNSGDTLTVICNGATVLTTNRVFRDNSAFYNITVVWDSGNATSGDRCRLWVNGIRETSFSTATYPSQNQDSFINNNTPHYIGVTNATANSNHFDGVMAHVHFIDGTAYDASYFGETDATTGIWKPKTAPVVTYGTNGFFLKFENSASFGADSSGNANNFAVNGTITQTIDTPSNVFCTMNPNNATLGGVTLSNGNTKASLNGNYQVFGNLQVTKGKWYWEQKINGTDLFCSVGDGNKSTQNTGTGLLNRNYAFAYRSDGVKQTNNTTASYGDSFTTNDIIMTALDMDNGFIYWGKNGVWQNSGDPTSGASGTGAAYSGLDTDTNIPDGLTPCLGQYSGAQTTEWNFGNGYFGTTAVASAQSPSDGIGIFEYEVPTGYKALCTKSINAQEYS